MPFGSVGEDAEERSIIPEEVADAQGPSTPFLTSRRMSPPHAQLRPVCFLLNAVRPLLPSPQLFLWLAPTDLPLFIHD